MLNYRQVYVPGMLVGHKGENLIPVLAKGCPRFAANLQILQTHFDEAQIA